ncbi:hypothetical protein BDW69DRAFT_173567 [Aspergillus filifer]
MSRWLSHVLLALVIQASAHIWRHDLSHIAGCQLSFLHEDAHWKIINLERSDSNFEEAILIDFPPLFTVDLSQPRLVQPWLKIVASQSARLGT